jgi:signal transduction histidine kinase
VLFSIAVSQSTFKERGLLLAGASALVVLLALLATLQYRWTGEVSEAEKGRLTSGARTRAERLARDFDREVTRAFLWLQVDAESLKTRDFGRYASRYARWRQLAENPRLVADVFVAERSGSGPMQLSRFEPDEGRFEATSWPPLLEGVQRRIETWAQGRFEGPRGPIFEDLPALLAAVPVPSVPAREGPPGTLGAFHLAGITVIVLDRDRIREEILPGLARRHFGAEGGLDYNLTVARRNEPNGVVYASDPAMVARAEDVSVGLLELRFEDMSEEDLSWMASRRPAATPDKGSAPRPTGRAPSFGGGRGPDAGRWRLTATHRLGSVDEIVAEARRRNLALSFGILLLLGASMALIVAATARSHRLAARQMEFVAGVSHELRTPVAVICAAGENLADGLVSAPHQVRRYGATVRDEGRRLAEMVERVLEFAGTYSGRAIYRFQALSVERLLEDARAAASARATELGVGIESTVAPGLPDVRGDAGAIRRVVVNLLENAMKYGAAGRWIRVVAEPASVNGRPAVRISVEDHGDGIPSAELSRVFEPFYRGRAAQEGQERGFGLGLSLVKRVVEAHGGAVRAQSEPGRGSTFSIVLPAAPEGLQLAALEERVDGVPHSAR